METEKRLKNCNVYISCITSHFCHYIMYPHHCNIHCSIRFFFLDITVTCNLQSLKKNMLYFLWHNEGLYMKNLKCPRDHGSRYAQHMLYSIEFIIVIRGTRQQCQAVHISFMICLGRHTAFVLVRGSGLNVFVCYSALSYALLLNPFNHAITLPRFEIDSFIYKKKEYTTFAD